jgi:membrane-bound lytic murein transglycosylase B
MTINLKTTILLGVSVAAALNVGQFFASYQQRELAFEPTWARADSEPAAAATQTHVGLTAAQPTVAAPTPAPTPPSAVANPVTPSAAVALTGAGLNPTYAALYVSVQQRTGTPWQLLAAVHETETGQSGSTDRTSYAGATGPMQFMPATFRRYAADGNGDGIANIDNLDDAVLTAGRYLAANGAATGNYSTALYAYNHSDSYVSHVLALADRLGL